VIKEAVRADEVFAELVRRDPDWYGYWDARLVDLARRRIWAQALPGISQVIARGNNASLHWNRLAALQAWSGDRRGLRESCRKILAMYGSANGSDRYQVREVVYACLLLPDTVDDLTPVRKLADVGITASDPNASDHHSFLVMRALVDYRAGDPGRAVERLEAISLVADDRWAYLGRIVLALAQFQIGRGADARQGLNRVSEALRQSRPRIDRGQQYGTKYWQDWIVPEVLLREAEELILDSGFPADPFVHGGH